jgi:hypothetical protein
VKALDWLDLGEEFLDIGAGGLAEAPPPREPGDGTPPVESGRLG